MTAYLALIHKEEASDYGVSFPDFPGCITAGSTLNEAFAMAREALEGHLECMAEDGEKIPSASSLDKVMSDPDNRGATAVLIEVSPPVKSVRINITMDDRLLTEIARVTPNRSRFLAEAAREKLDQMSR